LLDIMAILCNGDFHGGLSSAAIRTTRNRIAASTKSSEAPGRIFLLLSCQTPVSLQKS
jgi:hypothetical protein